MAQAGIIYGDYYIAGNLSSQSMTVPAGTLVNAGVNAAADIGASKLEHQHELTYAQASATNATDEARPVHVVYGTSGSVLSFKAGAIVAATGNATCAVDLKKNGATILSAAISLTSSHTARALVSATISTATLVAGDVLEVNVDGEVGTGALAKGVFANLVLTEKAS